MKVYFSRGQRDSGVRSVVELVRGIDEASVFIETRMQRWTATDCAKTFPDEWDGQKYELSPRSVIYHAMEHNLLNGGGISLILSWNGLRGIDLKSDYNSCRREF